MNGNAQFFDDYAQYEFEDMYNTVDSLVKSYGTQRLLETMIEYYRNPVGIPHIQKLVEDLYLTLDHYKKRYDNDRR